MKMLRNQKIDVYLQCRMTLERGFLKQRGLQFRAYSRILFLFEVV